MASAGAQAYNGSLGQSPQRGPGAELYVFDYMTRSFTASGGLRTPDQGVRGSKPEAEKLLVFFTQSRTKI